MTPDDPGGAIVAPLNLWLTDRSRYEAGIIHCPRARLYRYHHGDHGYGWDVQASSMPTLTGGLVHEPITAIWSECQRLEAAGIPPAPPTAEWVYVNAILPACAKFASIVETRGLGVITDPQELGLRVIEQQTLLEGLVWTYYYTVLPRFLEEYRVVLVEQELPVVLGCTCGLNNTGTLHDHDARECRGIGYMTRADLVAQHRLLGHYRYDEVKTTSDASTNWEAAWQYRAQVLTGVLGAEQQLGVTIDEVWIHGLIKGSFKAAWDPDTKRANGPKYQNSVLCYGWCQPANPPLSEEVWEHSYDLPPDVITGKGKKLPKTFKRTGIWEMASATWEAKACLSVSHYWCLLLLNAGLLEPQYRAVGPLRREAWRLLSVTTQIVGEEQRRQVGMWALYDALTAVDYDWAHASVIAVMDQYFPQAGGDACHSYFGSTCAYLRLCQHAPGWERPGDIGYIMRRPHHEPELDQMKARGLAPMAWGLAEEGE